jgi:hypothetical protein
MMNWKESGRNSHCVIWNIIQASAYLTKSCTCHFSRCLQQRYMSTAYRDVSRYLGTPHLPVCVTVCIHSVFIVQACYMSRTSYRQTLVSPGKLKVIHWRSPEQWVLVMSQSVIEASIMLYSVSLWLVWVKVQLACALNTRYMYTY